MDHSLTLYDVRSMTKMAICVAILCVSAYISFPLPFASAMVTALTLAMNLAAFVLTPQQTLIVMLLYTLIGAAGLPVFVGGCRRLWRNLRAPGRFPYRLHHRLSSRQLPERQPQRLEALPAGRRGGRHSHHLHRRPDLPDVLLTFKIMAGHVSRRVPLYPGGHHQSGGCRLYRSAH